MIMTEKRRVRRDRVDPGQVLALLGDLRLLATVAAAFPPPPRSPPHAAGKQN